MYLAWRLKTAATFLRCSKHEAASFLLSSVSKSSVFLEAYFKDSTRHSHPSVKKYPANSKALAQ
jgi:hypothetical protein